MERFFVFWAMVKFNVENQWKNYPRNILRSISSRSFSGCRVFSLLVSFNVFQNSFFQKSTRGYFFICSYLKNINSNIKVTFFVKKKKVFVPISLFLFSFFSIFKISHNESARVLNRGIDRATSRVL